MLFRSVHIERPARLRHGSPSRFAAKTAKHGVPPAHHHLLTTTRRSRSDQSSPPPDLSSLATIGAPPLRPASISAQIRRVEQEERVTGAKGGAARRKEQEAQVQKHRQMAAFPMAACRQGSHTHTSTEAKGFAASTKLCER